MAALVNKIVLSSMLVTIFITLQMMDGVESFSVIPKAKIGITNKIPNLQLGFRCKDKTRDNGFHILGPGQSYSFGFTLDIFLKRTLWFCRFQWEGASHFFDIFTQERDRCTTCNWEIQESGPCKFIAETRTRECYPWNDQKQQLQLQGGKKLLITTTTTQQEPPLALEPVNSQRKE